MPTSVSFRLLMRCACLLPRGLGQQQLPGGAERHQLALPCQVLTQMLHGLAVQLCSRTCLAGAELLVSATGPPGGRADGHSRRGDQRADDFLPVQLGRQLRGLWRRHLPRLRAHPHSSLLGPAVLHHSIPLHAHSMWRSGIWWHHTAPCPCLLPANMSCRAAAAPETDCVASALLQCRTNRVSTFSKNRFISNVSQGFGGAIKVATYAILWSTAPQRHRVSVCQNLGSRLLSWLMDF
jgi:hypothetical protein